MPFDDSLAARIRTALGRTKGVEEKKFFGVIAFLLHGNMFVGVWKDSLIVRLDPDDAEAALREPHAGAFDITGKPMKGWILVAREGVADVASVAGWVRQAKKFVAKLPAK